MVKLSSFFFFIHLVRGTRCTARGVAKHYRNNTEQSDKLRLYVYFSSRVVTLGPSASRCSLFSHSPTVIYTCRVLQPVRSVRLAQHQEEDEISTVTNHGGGNKCKPDRGQIADFSAIDQETGKRENGVGGERDLEHGSAWLH